MRIVTVFFLMAMCHFSMGDDGMEVSVSKGVVVENIPNVMLYTEEQYVHFFIPDLPDLPQLTSINCEEQPYTEACAVTAKLNDINSDSLLLLTLLNRMMTKTGLSGEEVEDVHAPNIKLNDPSPRTSNSEPPTEGFIKVVGMDWFKLLKQRLDLRKLGNMKEETLSRPSRAVPALLAPVMKGLAGVSALMGIDDVFGLFSHLFVSKDKILNIMTTLKAYLPINRQEFAEVVTRASEFERFTKEKFADILQDNNDLRNLTSILDEEIKTHRLDISVVQDGYSQNQRVLADTTTLLFTSILYIVQISAFHTCRANELPMIYVPPNLLHYTLARLEATLPEDVEFAIPLQNLHRYYTLKDMASCLYDDDGGTIRLTVPLRQRDAIHQLFEVRPIQFAWDRQTCLLGVDATHVIMEKKTGFVYPVTAVDAATCDPNQRRCKIPPSTADDTTSGCVSVILGGGTTDEIKSGCPIRCVDHSKPEVAKMTDSLFIATHIKPSTLAIECPSENLTISEEVKYGAIQIITPCSCKLRLNGRLIATSTKKICSSSDVLSVETILAAHFITSKDIIHFTEDGNNGPRYKHKEEIFDSHFMEQMQPKQDDNLVTTKINVYSVAWNLMQSILLGYSYFKMHNMGALLFQLTNGLPRVQASTNHYCKLPDEAYYLLVAILVVSVISIIPSMIYFFWKLMSTCFWETVSIEAKKMNLKEGTDAGMRRIRRSSCSSQESDFQGFRKTTRV